MSGDPVSWLMVERGWTVIDAYGKKVGKVDEVLGESDADIWDGLTVDGKYVPAEQVGPIVEGRITLTS